MIPEQNSTNIPEIELVRSRTGEYLTTPEDLTQETEQVARSTAEVLDLADDFETIRTGLVGEHPIEGHYMNFRGGFYKEFWETFVQLARLLRSNGEIAQHTNTEKHVPINKRISNDTLREVTIESIAYATEIKSRLEAKVKKLEADIQNAVSPKRENLEKELEINRLSIQRLDPYIKDCIKLGAKLVREQAKADAAWAEQRNAQAN